MHRSCQAHHLQEQVDHESQTILCQMGEAQREILVQILVEVGNYNVKNKNIHKAHNEMKILAPCAIILKIKKIMEE